MKKIMFNDRFGLTQAVLEGRKTQTRRVVKGIESLDFDAFGFYFKKDATQVLAFAKNGCIIKEIKLPIHMGETIAIAQSYKDVYEYRLASNLSFDLEEYNKAGWSNKMFVKAELMTHHIKITNVRVERLQDISEEDCLAEGIIFHPNDSPDIYYFFDNESSLWNGFNTAKKAYATLIDEVGKKGTWKSNPWVFVYEFELID